MSEIDVQNAKQIRDPMDVLIEMELASDDVTLSYSGYSGSAKVADGELDESTWPMRKLADLQGDGFPLDGSCVLYDSSTSPSQTNGKLGVRGNVGEAVTITITGNKSIASLFIYATGAESVTFGSTTTPIYNNVVTIPVGATSITITLNPASETTRIEVSQIEAGAKFIITNENLIRATVSLRSDLSIIDPTLPESEINIEAYQDTDISEAVASIPEDTPITYSAGYEGDMSPVRKFYVTGQVTWADNVLSIQGVDAVHFLDVSMFAFGFWMYIASETALTDLYDVMLAGARSLVPGTIQTGNVSTFFRAENPIPRLAAFPRGTNFRDAMATMNNLFRLRGLPPAASYTFQEFIFDYVDAGIPRLTIQQKPTRWSIVEEDCAEIKTNYDRAISSIFCNHTDTRELRGWHSWDEYRNYLRDYVEVGRGTFVKNSGVLLELSDNVFAFYVGVIHNGTMKALVPSFPNDDIYDVADEPGYFNLGNKEFSWQVDGLMDSETKQGEALMSRASNVPVYTQVIPWNIKYGTATDFNSMQQAWNWLVNNGYVENGAGQVDVTLYGGMLATETAEVYKTNPQSEQGRSVTLDLQLMGRVMLANIDEVAIGEAYPNKAIESLFERSPITGKFTWKGDPRMQPRDVVEWERLDGTTTTITLENITLTHEGGGTMAEITYREGVV